MSYEERGQQGGYGGYGNMEPYSTRPGLYDHTSLQYNNEKAAEGDAGSYQKTEVDLANAEGQDKVLDKVKAIDRAIDKVENDLKRLSGLHDRYLVATDTSAESPIRQEVERLSESIKSQYKDLVSGVKVLKSHAESGKPRNSAQISKVDRVLRTAIHQYQHVNSEYQRKLQAQITRQYRIVRPDITDSEVREAVAGPDNQQVFKEALIHYDRRGAVQAVAQKTKSRHMDIRKIEKDTTEVAQLFQDLDFLVVCQEPAIIEGEQKGVEVRDHVQEANEELTSAVEKAKAARRKKWYCLVIVVLIFVIVAGITVVVVKLTK